MDYICKFGISMHFFRSMEKKIRDSFCCCYLLNAQFSSPKLFFFSPFSFTYLAKQKKRQRKKCKNVKIRAISLFQYKKFFLLKWNCCCIEKLRKMSSTKFSLSVKQVHIVRWAKLQKDISIQGNLYLCIKFFIALFFTF